MSRILHALATEQHQTLEGAAAVEEWLLRPVRRRAAHAALRRADMQTQHNDTAHLARVARLLAAGAAAPSGGWDDVAAVSLAYAKLPPKPPSSWPKQTLFLTVLILLLGAGWGTWHVLTRPFAADGNALGYSFRQRFGGHVADVVNGSKIDPDTGLGNVFPGNALPASVRPSMRDLFAAQRETMADPRRMTEVFKKTREVNDALAAAGQPYFLDARYYRDKPILYAFYNERETEGSAPGFQPERMVFLWRLDRLNLTKAALGYTHRESSAGIVLYDQVEEFLIQDVLPALVEGETLELVDEASRDDKQAWQKDIEARAARMVRESFAGAAERERLLEVGTLLARRRAILRKWRTELSAQNRTLHEPKRLLPEADYVENLWQLVPSASRHEWQDVHDTLTSRRVMTTFEALRDRFATDVERHELQHRFDAQKTPGCDGTDPCPALDIPPAVRKRVGPSDTATKVGPGSMPGRVRNELSAYLAQMALPSGMPKMTLLSLLRTVLDRDAWGDVYCNTMLVLLDTLGAAYGQADESMPLVQAGRVQRGAVASLVAILFSKSDEELRATAKKVWQEQFAAEVPAVRVLLVRQGKRWRH